ncbi:MAG TPA: molybdopterin-binding protein [Anaerolineaceae bacterium]
MPAAEIIAIGTELLLGEIQDTNTRHLARALRDAGIDLYRTMVVGDNANRIARAIQEALSRAQIVITTGGLGPTVDDPTRQAVALAAGVEQVYVPELWEQITARFQRYGRTATENNRRQAYIPAGAIPIENPVGTAPAFFMEIGSGVVISLPGVPREMEYLYENAVLPFLRQRFQLRGVIKARVLHTAGLGESQVDALIGDMEEASNPTVGLLAHAGQVDIRITTKADTQDEADRLIALAEAELRARLGIDIYGVDNQTLDEVTRAALAERGIVPCVVESGLQGELSRRLNLACTQVHEKIDAYQLQAEVQTYPPHTMLVAAALVNLADRQALTIFVRLPSGEFQTSRTYGGPPALAPTWAVNNTLDFLRRQLLSPG